MCSRTYSAVVFSCIERKNGNVENVENDEICWRKKPIPQRKCLNSKCKNVCLLKAASCVHNQCISNKAKKKEKEKCKQTDISIIDEKGKNSNDFVNIVAILLHNQKKKICSQ